MSQQTKATREHARLEEIRSKQVPWRKWGPYLSERQWGGVRENLNRDVEAWNDVTHDQSRSRAYLSGEDGIAGFCDDQMLLCLSLALWNGKDPILKERMFGLTNSEGNHGEDVKEYYFYLDSTPTHSYMKMLYKYPQAEYPYGDLVAENRRRSKTEFEYELLDTGIFDEDRYWDVFVEFAKSDAEDISLKITAFNRGPEAATLHILPHLWFRNTWWVDEQAPRPELTARDHSKGSVIAAKHPTLGTALSLLRRPGRAPVHRQRDEQVPPLGPAEPHPVPEGRNQRLRRAAAQGRGQSRQEGDQVCGPPGRHRGSPARAPRFACASPTGRPAISPIRSPTSIRRSPTASARRTSSTRRSPRLR